MGSHQRRHDGTRQENPTRSGSGDEGEGDALGRQQSRGHPNVDGRLHRNGDRDGHSKPAGGRIGALPSNPPEGENETGKRRQHQCRAKHSRFLRQNGEDEIRLIHWQIAL